MTGTCLKCGQLVLIVNYARQVIDDRLIEFGYLGRHHRRGTRAGTKCAGSFGLWQERRN